MRSILGFLGVLLIPVSQAFAGDSSLDKYCGPNSPPQVCIAYADAALHRFFGNHRARHVLLQPPLGGLPGFLTLDSMMPHPAPSPSHLRASCCSGITRSGPQMVCSCNNSF